MRSRDPLDDVEPADYALPPGVPALQSDPIKTRRMFILVGLAGVAVGAAGVFMARSWTTSENPREQDRLLEWARSLARGPLQTLISGSGPFLLVVERCPSDSALWEGVERLIDHALADGASDQILRARLIASLRSAHPPESLANKVTRLTSRR